MRIKEFYVCDARERPGSVYQVGRGPEARLYTRRSGTLYSFAFSRAGILYVVDANDTKIFRVSGRRETAVYTHGTYVRDIAFQAGALYFSEATGAGGDGKIYRLNERTGRTTLVHRVPLAAVGGFWAGDFTFDGRGRLAVSSGNRIPSQIYVLDGGRWAEAFRLDRESMNGFAFLAGDLLCYASWRSEVYLLDLRTGGRTLIYDNPARAWLSDVAFLRPEIEDDTLYEGTKDYTSDGATLWRDDGTVDDRCAIFFPDADAAGGEIDALLADIGLPAARTEDDAEIWTRTRGVWAWLSGHVLAPGHPQHAAAQAYLSSLGRWPSIGDLAHMFAAYGGIVWGTCMSRAQAFATLLYRVGIPPDGLAIAETRWRPAYSQHMYVVLRIRGHWYYVDPTCLESHPALAAVPENVGCVPADYAHPNQLTLLPGSTLTKPMLVR